MRWAGLLAGLAAVAAVVALVIAVVGTHDGVPGALKDCLRRAGVEPAKGPEAVQLLRRDLNAGRSLRTTVRPVGEDDAVLLARPDYAVVVLRTPDNPPLGDDLLARAADDPAQFGVVAQAGKELRAVPADCVAIAATK